MNTNPLFDPLNELFNKIVLSKGIIFQTSSHLEKFYKDYRKSLERVRSDLPFPTTGVSLLISDLTGPNQGGWKIPMPTRSTYSVYLDEIEENYEKIIRRSSMLELSHCYEALETFLYDITASYIYNYKNSVRDQIKEFELLLYDYKTLRKKVRVLYNSTDNREILKLIRRLSPQFNMVEINNNEKTNLKDWFKVLSVTRNCITHSNFQFSEREYKKIKDNKPQLTFFQENFTYYEEQGVIFFNFHKEEVDTNLIRIAEYAFQIFKCLSIEQNLNWNIFNASKM